MQDLIKLWNLGYKVKKTTGIIYSILICLFFPLYVFSGEKTPVYIEKFKIHSSDKNDEYISEGINSVLTGLISPINGIKISEEYKNEGFIISGSIVIIDNSSITSASLKYNKQILESFNKKNEKKSDILNNINDFALICKKIIENKAVNQKPQMPLNEIKPSYNETQMEILFVSNPITEEIKSISCIDINNDKKKELAWITEKKLTISSFLNNELDVISSVDIPTELTPLSLESLKIRGTEMLIANLFDDKAKNFKARLYYFDDKSKMLMEDKSFPDNYFYKSSYSVSGEKFIIARKGDNFKTSLFRGNIKILDSKDFSFKDMEIQKEFEFFPSLVTGNYTKNDGKEWVSLDSKGSITIFTSNFDKVFETDSAFGGSVTYANYETKGRDEIDSRYFFPTRLIPVLMGNGKTMLLTIKNKDGGSRLLQRLRFFKEGSISGLMWDKISFEEFFSSRIFKGWISDFQICDIDMDGRKEIIIANPQKAKSFTKNPETRIIIIPFEKSLSDNK